MNIGTVDESVVDGSEAATMENQRVTFRTYLAKSILVQGLLSRSDYFNRHYVHC